MTSKRRFKFTTASIAKKALPPAPDSKAKDILYFDTKTTGFGIRVGRARPGGEPPIRTFFAMRDVRGKTKRISIGRFPSPFGVERAREEAEELLITMKRGGDPIAERRAEEAQAVTLREAVERHLDVMRINRRQPRSIKGLADDAERYFGGARWLDRELRSITRLECNELHKRLTTERGPYAANRALRAFRTVFRSAALVYETLPTCPTVAVTWNPEERKGAPIQWGVFPDFWRAIDEIRNPIRADLVRVLILTGLRSLDARTIRWEELSGLDGDEPTLHRPNPKGGPKKAFTVPISAAVAEILRRRRTENEVLFPGCPLVFPTIDRGGRNVVHIKNAEEDGLRDFGYTPHRARDTFATACAEAGVSVLATKMLLNHRDKTVTEGYQRLGIEFLRAAVETVTAFLLEKVVACGEESEAA